LNTKINGSRPTDHLLNFYKTNFVHLQIKTAFNVVYDNQLISKEYDTKILGINVESTLPWNAY
jgi:hypothetical protein